MKIAIDIRNVGRRRTGDEMVFVHLIRGLAKFDFHNEYSLLLDNRSDAELKSVARILEVENAANFRIIPVGSGGKFAWNTYVLARYLHSHPVDIYHTQYILPLFLSNSTRAVTHIHDVSFKAYPNMIDPIDRFFLNTLIPRSIQRADAVLAVSEFTKQEVRKYYGTEESKIHIIPNAVDGSFSPDGVSQKDRAHVRAKYHLFKPYILYVGTLQPRKNIPSLLEAFARIRRRLGSVKLVIVGNRNAHHYDTGIERVIAKHSLQEEVLFPGYVDSEDLPALYVMAQVFSFPSQYEGFGMPLLEAMACGVPVVASDIPAHREVAQKAVVFVNTADLDYFSEMLYTVFTSNVLRSTLRRDGLERVQCFSWEKSAQTLLSVYQGAVSQSLD